MVYSGNHAYKKDSGEEPRPSRRKQKPFLFRVWKFLRHAATGVIHGEKPLLLDLEIPARYRPNSITSLSATTGFSVPELKRMYASFKNECPAGLITPEIFHTIFSKFFPLGANLSSYSNYIFSALDRRSTGLITFEDFALGLAMLIKGTAEERLRWAFSVYDINKDGVLTQEEIRDITTSVYDLLGHPGGEKEKGGGPNEVFITRKSEIIFKRLDLNGDGQITLEEFMSVCLRDSAIFSSLESLSPTVPVTMFK
ncbi:Kv channel-interacting protein 1 [Eurytemora carolleeae]|uniref:Kv channel-interacting protein 1 n=1 Tax=Eurytemora carolleeae TaxID=1294199 RepID=UPI000C780C2A|nr:Kv channel-interacting protein 1 [Eurytemora carolleeae]|eukprot:XP_023343601.1 Kv channel-interacting protein 1-like [Eurytemora affinis]